MSFSSYAFRYQGGGVVGLNRLRDRHSGQSPISPFFKTTHYPKLPFLVNARNSGNLRKIIGERFPISTGKKAAKILVILGRFC